MYSQYPPAPLELLTPVRPHSSHAPMKGLSLNLLEGGKFQKQARRGTGENIIKSLINALFSSDGQDFLDCNPSFTLTRSSSPYPRLFTVSSKSNRGTSTSAELAIEAASYLTTRISKDIPSGNPLFLQFETRPKNEIAAFLGGFTAYEANLVPLVLLGGRLHSPPVETTYASTPFSQMVQPKVRRSSLY